MELLIKKDLLQVLDKESPEPFPEREQVVQSISKLRRLLKQEPRWHGPHRDEDLQESHPGDDVKRSSTVSLRSEKE